MSQRLPSLDGWRAVSICLVLGAHVAFTRACPPSISTFTDRIFDGLLGVRMFFTISGFIITHLLLKERARTGKLSLRQFYLRRSVRILPVYAGYLGFILILQLLGRLHEQPTSWLGSLTFTRNVVGRGPSPTMHFWSLAIEEQFYLFWPPLFKFLDLVRHQAFGIAAALAIVALTLLVRTLPVSANSGSLEKLVGAASLLRYADGLTVGCCTAFLVHNGWRRVPGWSAFLALAVFLLPEFRGAPTFGPFVQSVAFAVMMVYTIGSRGWAYRILNSRPLVVLGLLSYSLYVWHFIFLDFFAPGAIPFPVLTAWYSWLLPAFALAGLSWLILEAPARRRRRQPSLVAA